MGRSNAMFVASPWIWIWHCHDVSNHRSLPLVCEPLAIVHHYNASTRGNSRSRQDHIWDTPIHPCLFSLVASTATQPTAKTVCLSTQPYHLCQKNPSYTHFISHQPAVITGIGAQSSDRKKASTPKRFLCPTSTYEVPPIKGGRCSGYVNKSKTERGGANQPKRPYKSRRRDGGTKVESG